MHPVRILHVITQLELGGAQQSTLELLRRLDRRRYLPTLLTSPGGPLEADARAIPDLEVCLLPSLTRAIHPWRDLRALRALTAFMRAGRFDLVHTHSSKAGILGRWAARRARIPVTCHTIHGFAFHAHQPPWVRRAYEAAERLAARVTTHLIAVSGHDERIGVAAGIGQPWQYRRIPYGIDLARFHRNGLTPRTARGRLGLRPDAPTIGTVACFKPQKALGDFLAVCARVRRAVPEAQAVVAGDGRLRPQLERRRRALGLDGAVRFLGWRRDIPEVLAALDVFVLTSRWEGLPVAVLEAQAMGVPVVVTDTGGVRDGIANGSDGFLAPIGDVEGLSRPVEALLRDPGLARAVAARGAEQVRACHSIERMVQDTERLYKEALEAPGPGGS